MSKSKTTEEFISDAINTHGLKYSYASVNYVNAKTKVIIICPIHGEFVQIPKSHVQGAGCPKCAGTIQLDSATFISLATEIHNKKYDYSKVNYVNSKTKVIITCSIHGDFEQTPSHHLHRKQGCSKCGKLSMSSLQSSNTTNFIRSAKSVHGDTYDYSNTVYSTSKQKVIITCSVHGPFKQMPNTHLNGKGCNKCGEARAANLRKSNTQKFIEKSNIVHFDKNYSYNKVEYNTATTKVTITCPHHGDFLQMPMTHLRGGGCPDCATSGFQPSKPAYLYYLKVTTNEGRELYKIGITNRTVNERFNLTDLSKIEIVKQKLYADGAEALKWETRLKRMYKEYQYKGPDILSSGNTELFTEDIIAMWDNA